MFNQRFFAAILFAVIAVSSCKTNSINLSYTNAKGEVPQLGNLVFRFSKSLVNDSMLNVWDSTDYISFEPAIEGRFRWQGQDQLIFSPAQPLNPATTYKAKINSSALKFSKFNKVEGADKISFHTPDLALQTSQAIWIGEAGASAAPQLDFYFNYKVSPTEIKDRLNVEVAGQKADFTLITQSPDNKISIRLNNIKLEDKDYEVVVHLDKGLKAEMAGSSSKEIITNSFTIQSPFTVFIQSVEAEHDGVEGVVRVTASQQIVAANIKAYIKLDPTVDFTVEATETGFKIRSDKFDVEKSYSFTVLQNLRGKIGGTLKEEYNTSVAFGQLEANVQFTNNKAVYLSKRGARNIEVQVVNVPKVKLVISKIYENNLLMAQHYGYYPRETRSTNANYDEEGYYENNYDNYGSVGLGDVIYEKEIDTRSLPKSGAGRLLNLSQFEDRLPDFKGVYHVVIRSTTDYWVKDSRFISLSDIGLIAKEGQDKIFVFANSIKTASALAGVNVVAYASNNQLLAIGATNSEGLAELTYSKKEFAGFKPAMIIAKTADDFNYLPFNSTMVNTSRFDVGGKRNNPSGLDAFVYAERDIYRPGEKLNFAIIIRNHNWKSPGDMPLKLKLLMPNGKEFKSIKKNLNEEGMIDAVIDIPASAITGSYTLEVYTSNDILLSSKNFSIEEFVPDRIRMNSTLDKKFLQPAETGTLSINAMNFFGPPAANRNYETEIQVRQKYFTAVGFEEYDFSLANQNSFFSNIVREGKTDENGNAIEKYEVPAAYANMGLLQTMFYSTVFDETGRPVSKLVSADLFTQDVFFGVKRDWFYYYPLNQSVKVHLAAVNKDGKAASATAKLQVIKHEYRTVLTKSGDYFRYESQKDDKLMVESQVQVGANTVYSYTPRSPGDYEVRIYKPGANNYVRKTFYSYGNWGGNANSFEVNNEGNVDIVVDKKSYFTGDQLEAVFKTPFSGKMLVTMETDRVITHKYVDVAGRDAKLTFELTEENIPNVYLTATLIKPHEASDIPLTVAHGFKNIMVEAKNRKMDVAIQSAKAVRSKTKQKITVKADPGSYITLAAVDNAVLQVTDFKTPNPYDYFYQKKALQVSAYDLYPLLFAEMRAKLSSTGGDASLESAKRNNPMPNKRIKVMSYWSGVKKASGSGEAIFEVDLPQFSGELRLMAVACKGQSFGGSETNMIVADPIVISTALPRFLSPGDTISVPVILSNTTDKVINASASIITQGSLNIIGANEQPVLIEAKAERSVVFKLASAQAIGVGKITVAIKSNKETFIDETDISIRPPSTLQRRSGGGSIAGGAAQKLNISTVDFIPSSIDYSLVISKSPVLELGDQLQYLLQYPYGCTEQTISAAFPQLYYGDIVELMQLNKQKSTNANSNVIEAIRKIKMRQLYNGAITLWDNDGREDWWTTIYAAHFLLEAKKAGFDVDASLLETMLNYVSNRLKNKETITYYYNRDQSKQITPKEVAYSLYILSRAGRPNVPLMNYYKAGVPKLALDSRYLLSAAYAMAGDKKSFMSLLPSSFVGEESVAQTGGSFYSSMRDEAISLNMLIDVDPDNKQIPIMASHLAHKLKNENWLSTQERSFAFLALGKLARGSNNSNIIAEIKVNGKPIAKVSNGQWRGEKQALAGTNVEIATTGSGRLYYYWQAEGISASGSYIEEDSYLKVRKRFYNRFGQAVLSNNFKQNDLIIVGITLEKSFSTAVYNVVITDILPAGFEIENPRTKEIPGMDWIKDAALPSAIDVRDDRIHFFVDAINAKQIFYYAARAVSPGQYKMGPVSADAMYNGEYHSYNGAGLIRVTQ